MSLLHTEPVYAGMRIFLPRIETGGREIRMVRRIRIFLGLKRNGFPVTHRLPVFSGHRTIEEIAAVELHGRLVGKDFHESAACRFVDGCGKLYVPLRLTVQNPVVIISVSVPELLIVSPDPLPNGMRLAEIERCAGDIRNLSRRNQMPVDRGRMACIDHHDIVEYRSVADALEIEEGMV